MGDWVEAVAALGGLVTALGGAAGVRALVKRRPRRTNVDQAVALSEGSIRWAQQVEESATRALQRADAAEQKADAADRRADQAERQLAHLVTYLTHLLSAINDGTGTPEERLARIQRIAAGIPPLEGNRHESHS